MSEHIVLEHLRHIRSVLDQLVEDGNETRTRLAHLEEQGAHVLAQYASVSSRLDRQQRLIERIVKRLDLVDSH